MHVFANGRFDLSNNKPYKSFLAYAQSTLAKIMHAVELQRRFGERGIKAYALHPGFITSTELNRDQGFLRTALKAPFAVTAKTTAQGAMTTLYCALSDEAQPGKYHSNCRVAQPSSVVFNPDKAKELWNLTEEIINGKREDT